MVNHILCFLASAVFLSGGMYGDYVGSVTRPEASEGVLNVVDASQYMYKPEPILGVSEELTGAFWESSAYEEEDVYIPASSYSNDDLYVLAHVIAGEAYGCSWDLQAAVGSVVLNRVNHYAFPNDIYSVVFQSGQYACTWDGNYYREPTSTNWEVAEWLLSNGSTLPWYVIFQSASVVGDSFYTQIENVVFSYNSYDLG